MKKSKLIISLLILMIISAFSVKVVFADKASIGKVNAVTVNLREEASSSSKILVQLGEDTEVEILGTSGDWYQVEYDGISGYISKDYLDIVEEGDTLALVDEEDTTTETSNDTEEHVANETSTAVETEESTETTDEPEETEETVEEETTETVDTTATEFTLSKDAEIRVNPSFSSSKTTAIAEGSTVTVVDEINKWVKITDGNVTGWAVRQNIQ